jgi:ParB family chromosome partitioning protein
MSTAPKSRLGRGLGSLMSPPPAVAARPEAESGAEGRTYFQCPVEQIVPLAGQPRTVFDERRLEELANSIRESGIIQPLVVRQTGGGMYALIAGERRWRAAQRAGLTTVPVVVRETTDADVYVLALVENIQRADLSPVEEALAYERLLVETGMTHDGLADRVGKSRAAITNALRLLKLPEPVRELIRSGELSAGHARALLTAPEPVRLELAERIVSDELPVRQAEAIARELASQYDPATGELQGGGLHALLPEAEPAEPAPAPAKAAASAAPAKKPRKPANVTPLRPNLRSVQQRLVETYASRVQVHQNRNGAGRIELFFADEEALRTIVDLLLR